jgi:hypothetical protein
VRSQHADPIQHPVTLLAMISPFAIRVSLDETAARGQRRRQVVFHLHGRFGAGSLPAQPAGSFPVIGTSRTILAFGIATLAIGLIRAWR